MTGPARSTAPSAASCKGGEGLPAVDGELARLLIASVYGAELAATVHELVSPSKDQPDSIAAG